MSILSQILDELKKPDDMGRDWYGWASNQLAHAAIGVAIAGLVGVSGGEHFLALLSALSFAAAKEFFDNRAGARLKDSLHDILFQLLGAGFSVAILTHNAPLAHWVAGTVSLALIAGIIKRIKKAITGVA